jgi:hypothetical protein
VPEPPDAVIEAFVAPRQGYLEAVSRAYGDEARSLRAYARGEIGLVDE